MYKEISLEEFFKEKIHMTEFLDGGFYDIGFVLGSKIILIGRPVSTNNIISYIMEHFYNSLYGIKDEK
jgi:hypothetical protein